MRLQDALYNWLQMKVVTEARPEDTAAKDTLDFFWEILTEDHSVSNIEVQKDNTMYRLNVAVNGDKKMQMFDVESVEKLLSDIESEPRYNQ